MPPLHLHIRRNTAEASLSRVLPVAVRTLQSVRSELAEGYRFVSSNKLTEAQTTFRSVLQALLLVVVSSDDEGKEVITVFTTCLAPLTYSNSGETRLLLAVNICWVSP